MSLFIILVLYIILILFVAWIVLYTEGYFSSNPSDLAPFKDFKYAIEPSLKRQAKEDYNIIVKTIFNVLNNQTAAIEGTALSVKLINDLDKELKPLFASIRNKYTPRVIGKLYKYFVCKHLIILLDNYYAGPPIYINVPDIPELKIRAFPFVYHAKRHAGTKPRKGSTLAPFKHFAHNIPVSIRDKVTELYDHLLRKYARIFNGLVADLDEVNNKTLFSLDLNNVIKNNISTIQEDLLKIQRIFGTNTSDLITTILMTNVLPVLNKYYVGPSINFTVPVQIPSNPQLVSINFPNTDSKQVFTVVQGCLDGETLKIVNAGSFGYINQCVPSSTIVTVKPSELLPFMEISQSISSALLPEATSVYNESVLKYFDILNKYPLIDNNNIDSIINEITKTFYVNNSSFKLLLNKLSNDSINGTIMNNLLNYFWPNKNINKNDFIKNVLPLLNNYYNGKINIDHYIYNGSVMSFKYKNGDRKIVYSFSEILKNNN